MEQYGNAYRVLVGKPEGKMPLGRPRRRYEDNHHQSVLPKDRYFTANSVAKAAVLSKERSSTAKSGTIVVVLLWII